LIGDEYVKYASGHSANLGAEAIAAIGDPPSVCDAATVATELDFDGVQYNRLPRVLADDSIPSRLDSNDTKLIVNRIGGNLIASAGTLSTLFAVVYDDAENTFSTSFSGNCHLEISLGANNLPRVVGGWNALIPAGHTGWIKLWGGGGPITILGAAINFNANAAAGNPNHPGDFSGGHNLHKLTLASGAFYIIPVFPPSC
jgi:hypothetical protein